MPEAICCFYIQALNVVASEVMVGDTCVPSLIVIVTAVNQLETKVSLKNNLLPEAICCCLQTCNVAASEERNSG